MNIAVQNEGFLKLEMRQCKADPWQLMAITLSALHHSHPKALSWEKSLALLLSLSDWGIFFSEMLKKQFVASPLRYHSAFRRRVKQVKKGILLALNSEEYAWQRIC